MEQHHLLIEAVKDNNSGSIEELLNKGFNANVRDSEGYSPLYWACCRGHVDACRRLLRRGCDVNAKGRADATALMAAADNGHVTCVTLLIQHRSIRLDEQSERGDTALHMAAYRGFMNIVRLLCQAGARTDLKNSNRQTPLGEAFIQGQTECARYLNTVVQSKADNHENTSGSHSLKHEHAQSAQSKPQPIESNNGVYSSPSINDTGGATSNDNSTHLSSPSSNETVRKNLRQLPPCDVSTAQSTSGKAASAANVAMDTMGYNSCCLSSYSDSGPPFSFSRNVEHSDSGRYTDSGIHSLDPRNSFSQSAGNNSCPTSSIGGLSSPSSDSQYRWQDSAGYPSRPPSVSQSSPATKHNTSMNISSGGNLLPQNIPPTNERNYSSVHHFSQNMPAEKAQNFASQLSLAKSRENILPEDMFMLHASKAPKLPPRRLASEGKENGGRSGGSEPLAGIKLSAFIESLQMRVLHLEEALSQERTSKAEMRKDIVRLKEENVKLRTLVKSLSSRCSELTTKVSPRESTSS